MIQLSIDEINKNSLYRVKQVADDTVEFSTDYGVEYRINFMTDCTIWEENAYQLVIINKNRRPSPNDEKLKQTLLAIVESFFSQNENILLYICDTGDGKQSARSKLFLRWFASYSKVSEYYLKNTEIISEGVSNFAALIVRRDNPDVDDIIQEFEHVTAMLGSKPE